LTSDQVTELLIQKRAIIVGLDIPTGCHGNALSSKCSETLGSSYHIVYLSRAIFLHHSLLTHKENWDVFVCPLSFISWMFSFFKNPKWRIASKQVVNMRREERCYFLDTDLA
jgi:hypothetical protein